MQALTSGLPHLISWLSHWRGVWLWMTYLTSLGLSFLICKTGRSNWRFKEMLCDTFLAHCGHMTNVTFPAVFHLPGRSALKLSLHEVANTLSSFLWIPEASRVRARLSEDGLDTNYPALCWTVFCVSLCLPRELAGIPRKTFYFVIPLTNMCWKRAAPGPRGISSGAASQVSCSRDETPIHPTRSCKMFSPDAITAVMGKDSHHENITGSSGALGSLLWGNDI